MSLPTRHSVTRQRVPLGTTTIAVQVLGAGPPLLLVHGLSGSARWWRYNADALASQFRVYLIDLAGFGASRGQRFVLSVAGESLLALMDRLEIERASLIGHSMGGAVVADVAATYPERVERLVLVDAALMPFEMPLFAHAYRLLHEGRRLPLAFLPVLATDALRAGPGTLLRAALEIRAIDARATLEHIRAPTLLVWGERDLLVPLALGRALHQAIPASELVVLTGAGHNAMWDCPLGFNRAVLGFLTGQSAVACERSIGCR